MVKKLEIASSENIAIIINNTCNLTCNACGTLQCYNFKGTYRWSEESHFYEKWAEIANFPHIDILGGEPYLNPELYEWCYNIRRLWPDSELNIQTNGTLLHLPKNIEITRKIFDLNIGIIVSCHDRADYEKFEGYLWKIFEDCKNEITVEDVVNDEGKDVAMTSDISRSWKRNGKHLVHHVLVDKMFPNYVKELRNGVLYLDDGDPVKSHENCVYATNCYTIQRGLFYKCPLVFNYAEMKTQVKYEERAYPLLNAYKECSPYDKIEDIEKFFNNLDKPISACSLCAFEKKKEPLKQWVEVTFDKSFKKAFKGIE